MNNNNKSMSSDNKSMNSECFSQLMTEIHKQIHQQQIQQQREISQVINMNPQINILYPNQFQFQPYFYFSPFDLIYHNYSYNNVFQNLFPQINIGKNFYQVNYNVNHEENDSNNINFQNNNSFNNNITFKQANNPFYNNNNIQLPENNNNFKIIKEEKNLNNNSQYENIIEKKDKKKEFNENLKEDIQYLEKKREENDTKENSSKNKKSENNIIDENLEIKEIKKRKMKRRKKKGKKAILKKNSQNTNRNDKNNISNINNDDNNNNKKSNSKNFLNPIINMSLRSKNSSLNNSNKNNNNNQEIISIKNPEEESILYNDLRNHLNDKFFDLVNNKKHTKKYRESNYISSKNPQEFMELNFYNKMKEKFIPRSKENIKSCNNIPQLYSHKINKEEKVVSSYNYKKFLEVNKDLKIREILKEIEKFWPKNLITYFDDRALNFLAISNYNVDLAFDHIKNKTREFLSYIEELNNQNSNFDNNILNSCHIKKEKNRK